MGLNKQQQQEEEEEEEAFLRSFLKHSFHTLSITAISLLFPLSFLTLARFTAACGTTLFIPPPSSSNLAPVFLQAGLPVIHAFVSLICLAALVHSLTGRVVRLPSSVAWSFLCLFQLCLSLGAELTIAAGVGSLNTAHTNDDFTWIKRTVLFVGLYRTMRTWEKMVVKRVADGTIFGAEVKEDCSDEAVVSVAFTTLWMLMLQRDVERMVFAAVDEGLTKEMELDGYARLFVSHAIVMTGIVRSVQGLLYVGKWLFCRFREADDDRFYSAAAADHKV